MGFFPAGLCTLLLIVLLKSKLLLVGIDYNNTININTVLSGFCFSFLSFCRFGLSSFVLMLLVGAFLRCCSDIFLPSRPRTGLATAFITWYG